MVADWLDRDCFVVIVFVMEFIVKYIGVVLLSIILYRICLKVFWKEIWILWNISFYCKYKYVNDIGYFVI